MCSTDEPAGDTVADAEWLCLQITEADIRKFLPPDTVYVSERAASAVLHPAAANNSLAGGGAKHTDISLSPQLDVKPTAAQKHGKQLDDMLLAKEQENLKRADARIADYNAVIKVPCRDALP